MLYEMREMQHDILAPWGAMARASQEMFSNPFSPLSYFPASRRMAAGAELFYRLTQRYEKPEFGLTTTIVDGREVPVRETVVLEKPFCRLLHFERVFSTEQAANDGPARRDPAILVVAPLSGHFATLLRDTV